MEPVKILLAEDNKLNQMLVRLLLQKHQMELDEADNGSEAIEKLRVFPDYDLVLMDIQMPEMNGIEATRRIRNELKNNVPILAITGSESKEDLAECIQAGMNDHILKPILEGTLIPKIKEYLRR